MFIVWFHNLSNRSLVIAILICLSLIYVSFTFNSCLISNINWTLRKQMKEMSSESVDLKNKNNNNNVIQIHNEMNENKRNRKKTLLHEYFERFLYSAAATNAAYWMKNRDNNDSDNSVNDVTRNQFKYRFLRQTGSKPSRNLPDTLIIGVKKSGTRALLEFIRLHPDVRAAGYEVHFFDRYYQRGLHWYKHHMPYTLEGQITMEKTPSYFITKEVPKRVYKMNPNIRLLIVVRDPVTRAISDYTQAASKKFDMKRFEDLAFVNGSYAIVDTNWGPVKLGVYARFLEKWLRYFPIKQFLFISGERLIRDPAYEIGRVQDFLNLKRIVTEKHFYFNTTKGFPCLLKSESRSTPHCLGKTKGRNHPYIDIDAIDRLREFYRPFNERFYQMTGINFAWP